MDDNKKPKLLIVTGPTAVGKTEFSIALAKKYNGSIISADSMQVYRYMDIGTAKIMPEEMQGIPHYLVDVLDPSEEFNVVRFQQMAKEAIQDIYAKGRLPIVVGGTGFYIQALLRDIDFEETQKETVYREELTAFAHTHGTKALHDKLRQVDEKSAAAIHPNNIKRVIRALEFYKETKTPISEHNEEQQQRTSPYDFRYFVLNQNRSVLYERIEQRIDLMLKQGLIDEVAHLRDMGYTRDMISMQALGYKEILDYLDGITSLEEAVYILKRDTRHFAKRQLTWFRREPDVIWLDKENYPTTKELMEQISTHLSYL